MDKYYGRTHHTWCAMTLFSSIVMIACGILMVYTGYERIPAILVGVGTTVFVLSLWLTISSGVAIRKFLDIVSTEGSEIASDILSTFPVPIIIANVDGTIRWYNRSLAKLLGTDNLLGVQVGHAVKEIKWGDVLKTKNFFTKSVNIDDKRYELAGRIVKAKDKIAEDKEAYSVYIYFFDRSSYDEIKKRYDDERTDMALVCIDNYDEVMQRMEDNEEEMVSSKVRQCLNAWAQKGGAVIKRQENDRYYVIFDHSVLEKFIEDKFSVVENVRRIGQEYDAPVSISIGIGSGGTLIENEQFSRSAIEMAQGRGGDQVCVKTKDSLRFYGGTTKEYEKSNRVKTRSVAGALKEFMLNADKVFLMGHAMADYDCFGAAMGLQRAVRELGKEPYIVTDRNSPAVALMRSEVEANEAYSGMLIYPEEAKEIVTPNSLVVILDTHRPSMLPCAALLECKGKVVVIDHHRRSTEFINPCALVYHEPYASSACEMVTELMDYMDMGGKLTKKEAQYLYAGILMDTKNFMVKTGVRTFEAASLLRKLGVNTVEVKRLFNLDKSDYDHKVDIVKTASELAGGISIAEAKEQYPNIRVIASQAADEMLNVGNTKASIVIYPMDKGFGICARSIGDINVQLIMEALGGGGHATVAGAQSDSKDIYTVRQEVENAVSKYLKNAQ